MNFDLIIFDCDGVLVDSEVISCRAHADVLTRHGYPITQEQVFDRFLGRSTRQANLEVEAELGRALPDDFHVAVAGRDCSGRSRPILEAMPHIDEALDAITQPVCVASSGSPENISATPRSRPPLRSIRAEYLLGLAGRERQARARSVSVCRQQMNVPPERCLVIEDSVPGVTGGRAAGMTVLGFHGGSHCRPGHGDGLRAAGAAADHSTICGNCRVD